jgi:hypothetical protein
MNCSFFLFSTLAIRCQFFLPAYTLDASIAIALRTREAFIFWDHSWLGNMGHYRVWGLCRGLGGLASGPVFSPVLLPVLAANFRCWLILVSVKSHFGDELSERLKAVSGSFSNICYIVFLSVVKLEVMLLLLQQPSHWALCTNRTNRHPQHWIRWCRCLLLRTYIAKRWMHMSLFVMGFSYFYMCFLLWRHTNGTPVLAIALWRTDDAITAYLLPKDPNCAI